MYFVSVPVDNLVMNSISGSRCIALSEKIMLLVNRGGRKPECFVFFKIYSSSYSRVTLKRVTRGKVGIRGLTPGQHFSEDTSQRWLA